ncbi:hypothetical protein HDU76_009581, partial [Blyttiomyces sp. JEL0837]
SPDCDIVLNAFPWVPVNPGLPGGCCGQTNPEPFHCNGNNEVTVVRVNYYDSRPAAPLDLNLLNLQSLIVLDIYYNSFSGPVPPFNAPTLQE